MDAATIATAGIGTPRARLMYELCDRAERLVVLDGGDWHAVLTSLAWYLRLPDRPAGILRPGLIVPNATVASDTVGNLSLLGIGGRHETPVPGASTGYEVGVMVATQVPDLPYSIGTHDVVILHPAVTHLRPELQAKVQAGKVILLGGGNQTLADQAPRLLTSRPRRTDFDVPLELILAGAA